MLQMLQIVPIMWRAVRPSRVTDMPAVKNAFWLRKGYEGLTFFGTILTPTQREADAFNGAYSVMKNHEMIHLRQAQACGDSWLRFLSAVYLVLAEGPPHESADAACGLSAQPLRDGGLQSDVRPALSRPL